MALIHRRDSAAKRMRSNKGKPPPRHPKFPKDILKRNGVNGKPAVISGPYNAVLGTAHAENRLNDFFGVDTNQLALHVAAPHLSQWVSEALAAIAYKGKKAHILTKKICFPQVGWKRMKQRIHIFEDDVLTHVLRNICNMFKLLRMQYVNANAPIVECLEESDLLWQNILEPLTGVAQIMTEVIFRGHTNLEIHRIDGLKLARSLRLMGEELQLTAAMLDSMIGLIATKWTDRTVLMAIETAQKWRSATIDRMGLHEFYNEFDDDADTDDVKVLDRAKLLAKLKIPMLPGDSQGPESKKAAESAAQAKTETAASSSRKIRSILKPARKMPSSGELNVLPPQKQTADDIMEAMLDESEREYSKRGNEQPTRHNRAYAAARNRQPHSGLLMNDQDMELDPLRLAQLKGVGNTGSILSYSAFPSEHLSDIRPRAEFVSQGPSRGPKEDKGKGKAPERRSELKKRSVEIPENNRQNGKPAEIERLQPSDRPRQNKEVTEPKVDGRKDVDRAQARIEEIKHPRVRFAEPNPKDQVTSSGPKAGGSSTTGSTSTKGHGSSSRTAEEGTTSHTGSQEVGEPSKSTVDEVRSIRRARRNSAILNARRASMRGKAGNSSPGNSDRPFPIPVRVGNEVIPAPPRITRSQSPFENHIVDRSLVPAPLALRQTRSKSPFEDSGAGFRGDPTAVPAPLKLGHKRSQAVFENRVAGFSGDGSMMAATLNTEEMRPHSPIGNSDINVAEENSLLAFKASHKRTESPLPYRGVGVQPGPSTMSLADYESSPAGPPPNRPLPPLPTNRK
ncbi:hypothetical protein V493_01720 [Pseudogymnoascus sp. VKM F-4281 (FW-2241)]|nr:hypothetical protein V493_01720 [Pseudogymnoascus sp. VKM F-4281 (FW-2241)]